MKKITKLNIYSKIVNQYFRSGVKTNNYKFPLDFEHTIKSERLYYILSQDNAFILHKKANIYNLYYYINDFSQRVDFPQDSPIIIEIIYHRQREVDSKITDYWGSYNIDVSQTRINMALYLKENNVIANSRSKHVVRFIETFEDVEWTYNLLNNSLNPLTSNIQTIDELLTISKNNKILSVYVDNELAGILHFEVKLNNVWLEHLAVSKKYRGLGIASALIEKYIEINQLKKKTRFQLWVDKNNIGAIALYRKIGFVDINKRMSTIVINSKGGINE